MSTFPRVIEEPGAVSDEIRRVAIGKALQGYTHDTGHTNLHLHTRGREVKAHSRPVDEDFATVVIFADDTEVGIFLHTAEDAEALMEAAEAAFKHLRDAEVAAKKAQQHEAMQQVYGV